VHWKHVLQDCGIEISYALSPAAKGKIERPYQWLQDHLVRTCVREGIKKIGEAREILYREVYLYNAQRVHSTTLEIPNIRFERALKNNQSLFKKLPLGISGQTHDDLFALRWQRVINPYRKISINNLTFSAPGAPIGSSVDVRITFDSSLSHAKLRLWHQSNFLAEYTIKATDLKRH
jgi:hypothetical protein